jgi:hypothetical protein
MKQIPPELTGRALRDPEFHRQLLTDPETAAASAGYALDQDQIDLLKNPPPDATDRAAEAINEDAPNPYG